MMLGRNKIDTNILVRYFVQDDQAQAAKASEILERHAKTGKIFINQIVVCEAMWVLLGAYKFSKKQVTELLEKMLSTDPFEFEDQQEIWDALSDYKSSTTDFADCLIGRKNKAAECTTTFSFDKSLKANSGFSVLK